MKTYAVLTAVGPDRPGLVDELSERLSERRINIEDSRMAVLGGEFAVLMLIGGPPVAVERLLSSVEPLSGKTGLVFHIKRAHAPGERAAPSIIYRLHATSMDHPGIVHEITKALHERNCNIQSLETRVHPAPHSGAPVFSMDAHVAVPTDVKISELREGLYELGDDMNVDISFDSVD